MYSSYYRLRMRCLDKCLKSPVSEDPSTRYMVIGPKHFLNLKTSTFTIVIDHVGCN